MSDVVTGLFVDRAHRVCVGLPGGTIQFGLDPDELRGFAAALLIAADGIETEAAGAADAALAKASRLRGAH